ncbi:N-lysine methyltransferase KMT5A-like [Mercenaria mercenaria]|uniref:N-lysine methyltransferase KMT5A-like n=1 Tax=Mercenaria mercenaria TaxID=6596 RepID=UPI00234E8996|nr:N-lysine methyltransferase KMT5A-like [Mercenaria mercenaria]
MASFRGTSSPSSSASTASTSNSSSLAKTDLQTEEEEDSDSGFGIFAKKDFKQGDFLLELEYVGDVINTQEAEKRSKIYSREPKSTPRCYMYYFYYKGEERCIDATKETQRLAKFVNDASMKDPKCNAKMKLIVCEGYPRLCLFSIKDIKCGEEIRYDYGEDENLLFWRTKLNIRKFQKYFVSVMDIPMDEFIHKQSEIESSSVMLL